MGVVADIEESSRSFCIPFMAITIPETEVNSMTTRDLRKTDELISTADFCARTASQIRMWPARRSLTDEQAVQQSVNFLDDALTGGRFVAAIDGEGVAAATASLDPLTWAADLRFTAAIPSDDARVTDVEYQELVEFLERKREILCALQNGDSPDDDELGSAAEFFSGLGRIIGEKADSILRRPESASAVIFEQSPNL